MKKDVRYDQTWELITLANWKRDFMFFRDVEKKDSQRKKKRLTKKGKK